MTLSMNVKNPLRFAGIFILLVLISVSSTAAFYFSDIQFTTNEFIESDSLKPADSLALILPVPAADSSLPVTDPIAEETIHSSQFDKIFTVRGETLVAKVKTTNVYELIYTWPLNTIEQKMPRAEILEVVYADGRKESFRPKPGQSVEESKDWAVVITEKDWERVMTAYNDSDITGLAELGKVTARYDASKINATTEYLEKNALIILKKRAARLGSNIVFVTDKKEYRAYGELPSIEITGTAYLRH
jgi:hypothetical protein